MRLLLGYDVGSSSIKASLLDAQTGRVVAGATSPERELEIKAPRAGWAEQEPEVWWEHIKAATGKLKASANFDPADVEAIGISYQMHGLVAVDKQLRVLRPAIIWCDSRAVETGREVVEKLGQKRCLERLLNLPGNFTASKLKWVKDNEPDVFAKIYRVMLPGDYVAMRMTGEARTTPSGLSEGIMWDFEADGPADFVLEGMEIDKNLLSPVSETFSVQGRLSGEAAAELGLRKGTAVSYRGGDQPNNAFSLRVLEPGEVAVTAGTSGVVYAVTDKKSVDAASRVNVFVHINHEKETPRYGILLCLNGAGILNSWLRSQFAAEGGEVLSYERMNELAAEVEPGSEGLFILPYGNGAERTLGNVDMGAVAAGWNFNMHKRRHFFRAGQEGIVFALNYGLTIMRQMGADVRTVRAGFSNMFLSPVFAEVFAAVTGATVELYNTDGSQGAARGAGVGAGIYGSLQEAFVGLEPVKKVEPDEGLRKRYAGIYKQWAGLLDYELGRCVC